MNKFRAFIQRYVDPEDRLGEALFGLIMALGFTGAVRLGVDEASNRELFVAILGCNLAWAIVDGVMFAMLSVFSRGLQARVIRAVAKAETDEAAMQRIAEHFDDRVAPLTNEEERREIYGWVLKLARRAKEAKHGVTREDLFGGVCVALLILLATMPVLIPFLVIADVAVAVRVSNLIAIALLFWLGWWWGKQVARHPMRLGAVMMLIGVVLVGVTIVMGG